ncbi:MAG: ROK family protein [bacterium]
MIEKSVIGVDLGGTNVMAGRINGNQIVKEEKRQIKSDSKQEAIIEMIINSIESVYSSEVAGMGIGVPSLVDLNKGIVYDVQNIPSWKKVPLKKIVEKHFNLPVYINNDANCFAVGEKYFGKGIKYRNMVGVTLGTGIGTGIIINNRLYSGSNCGAGEFGSLPYRDGIIEDYCSGKFFTSLYHTTGEDLFQRAEEGDKHALEIFKQYGDYLGVAVIFILYSVDPEAIIFGGSVSKSFKYFKDSLWKRLQSFPYKRTIKNLVVEESGNHNIALLGAGALYIEASKEVI